MYIWRSRSHFHCKGGVLAVVAAFCLALSGTSAAQDAKELFSQKCASCHAADGSGHTAANNKMKIPDLRSARIKQLSDDELYTATAQGQSHESYPHAFLHVGLTEKQIRDLIQYIRTFADKK